MALELLKELFTVVMNVLIKENIMLTDTQKELFKDRSGFDYDNMPDECSKDEEFTSFRTPYPYNDREWKLSPWWFTFVIEENGNLITEIEHRMTNNRIIGWDKEGKKLSNEITSKYFK